MCLYLAINIAIYVVSRVTVKITIAARKIQKSCSSKSNNNSVIKLSSIGFCVYSLPTPLCIAIKLGGARNVFIAHAHKFRVAITK